MKNTQSIPAEYPINSVFKGKSAFFGVFEKVFVSKQPVQMSLWW